MAGKKIKKDKETNIDKGIKRYLPLIIALVVLALVFVALYYAFAGIGKVKYEGLVFMKQKYGSLEVYTYTYKTINEDGRVAENAIYLRTDPRENKIPVEGEIIYPEGKTVLISINATNLTECEDNAIAVATLSSFLVANGLVIKGGTPDKQEAEENDQNYITCGKYPANTVISIRAADKTEITRTGLLCYNVNVANCEIMPAVEKFILQSILDSRSD